MQCILTIVLDLETFKEQFRFRSCSLPQGRGPSSARVTLSDRKEYAAILLIFIELVFSSFENHLWPTLAETEDQDQAVALLSLRQPLSETQIFLSPLL